MLRLDCPHATLAVGQYAVILEVSLGPGKLRHQFLFRRLPQQCWVCVLVRAERKPYLSESDVTAYLSEGLAGLSSFMTEDDLATAGYVSSSSFASALEQYLSDYGGETIYNAISQYINPQAE